MTQVFEQLRGTVAISEPECLLPFAAEPEMFRDEKGNGFNRTDALKACLLALVASSSATRGDELEEGAKMNVVIKPKAHAIAITAELDSMFPGGVRHLYLYRHPEEYVKSVVTVFNSLMHPVVREAVVRFSIKMDMKGFVNTHFLDPATPRATRVRNLMEKLDMRKNSVRFATLFCANIMSVAEHLEVNRLDFKFVSYHELVQDTSSVMRDVASFCGMAYEGVAADEVILPQSDSQNKSGLSRQNLTAYKEVLDEQKIRDIDHVLDCLGFPSCKEFPKDSASFEKIVQRL